MATPKHIFRVRISAPPEAADGIAAAIESHLDSVAWTHDEDGILAEAVITGFASGPPNEAAIHQATAVAAEAARLETPEIDIAQVQIRDWAADNLKEFPPLAAGRYFVHGAHYEGIVPAGKIGLRIPPGAAFGTGDHGSTRGCLLALDAMRGAAPRHVLDMGCGSGILALAAAKRWRGAGKIVAADIDPKAIEIAAANFAANGVGNRVESVVSRGYGARPVRRNSYDLILANILARPLTRMAKDLARHLAPGGTAILSGLVTRDVAQVLTAHRRQGLFPVRWVVIDDWTTLVLKRRKN